MCISLTVTISVAVGLNVPAEMLAVIEVIVLDSVRLAVSHVSDSDALPAFLMKFRVHREHLEMVALSHVRVSQLLMAGHSVTST